jgi:DNA-cytosine methyltransferase
VFGVNVLSLFDGMSCGRIALERAGVKVDNYYASEIDKYAITVAQKNYPDTIQLGSVLDVKGADLPKIDLLIGGSPCQGFSFAGKQLNFDDPRSKLFFEFVRLKEELNPKYFLLENVKMKKESQDVISEYLGVEPVEINSALVSAQNRKRLYWTNIPFDMPEDKGIKLKDVLINNGTPIIYNRKDGYVKHIEKSLCIMSSDWRGLNRNQNQTAIMDENIINSLIDNPVILHNIYGGFKEKNVRVFTEKSPTIRTAAGGGHIPSTVDLEKLMLSPKAIEYMDRLRNGKPRWEYHTNPLDGKAACLTANMFKGVTYGVIKELVRKLHPIECERLQTVPDNYTEGVSDTQRYKMLGNGWTVDVVASIFKGIVEYEGFLPVICASDCIYDDWDEDKEYPVCPVCLYAYEDCIHPGPTMDIEYKEINGKLYGRL